MQLVECGSHGSGNSSGSPCKKAASLTPLSSLASCNADGKPDRTSRATSTPRDGGGKRTGTNRRSLSGWRDSSKTYETPGYVRDRRSKVISAAKDLQAFACKQRASSTPLTDRIKEHRRRAMSNKVEALCSEVSRLLVAEHDWELARAMDAQIQREQQADVPIAVRPPHELPHERPEERPEQVSHEAQQVPEDIKLPLFTLSAGVSRATDEASGRQPVTLDIDIGETALRGAGPVGGEAVEVGVAGVGGGGFDPSRMTTDELLQTLAAIEELEIEVQTISSRMRQRKAACLRAMRGDRGGDRGGDRDTVA